MEIAIHREQYKGLGMAEDVIKKHPSCENNAETARQSRDNDGWIPCSERTPGTQKVLITDGEIVMCGYRRPDGIWKYGTGTENIFSKISSIGVIAWQPLPEPYKPPVESAEEKSMREREECFKDGEEI